uniref:Phage head completion protein (GPL) n=1 Tax=Candidatus Kentrum sp. FM TaxID=2126340 RepID=A0A450RX21_9GAMM|nr:MAG: Phage head completion protein (GPL) [Candidatus Kentron sp. FM]VFJ43638.1 MAG: Phage head completion protein (GPL) [Candidatus Kentron sp. FM]VFK05648.1 MAG: Phage head completion protein (GPL) [Candidatus Kentron sp. FM]
MGFTGNQAIPLTGRITSSDFWPEISLADFQDVVRPPSEYSAALCRACVFSAVIWVNELLAGLTDEQDPPPATLAELSDSVTSGQAIRFTEDGADEPGIEIRLLVFYYREAVYFRAKALLLRHFPTLNRREEAVNMAKESTDEMSFWLTEATARIRWIRLHAGVLSDSLAADGCFVTGI